MNRFYLLLWNNRFNKRLILEFYICKLLTFLVIEGSYSLNTCLLLWSVNFEVHLLDNKGLNSV